MSEAKFTPGPWWVGDDEDDHLFLVWAPDSDSYPVASAAPNESGPRSKATCAANARLIAATPDGYALAAAIDAHYSASLDYQPPYVAMARALLAKAEGKP